MHGIHALSHPESFLGTVSKGFILFALELILLRERRGLCIAVLLSYLLRKYWVYLLLGMNLMMRMSLGDLFSTPLSNSPSDLGDRWTAADGCTNTFSASRSFSFSRLLLSFSFGVEFPVKDKDEIESNAELTTTVGGSIAQLLVNLQITGQTLIAKIRLRCINADWVDNSRVNSLCRSSHSP